MNVCILTGFLPGRRVGGATSTYVAEVSRQLTERGHRVLILACREGDTLPGKEKDIGGASAVQLPRLRLPIVKTLVTNIEVVWSLIRMQREWQFDVVQVEDFVSALLFYLLRRWLFPRCLVLQSVHAAICYEVLFDGRRAIARCEQQGRRLRLVGRMYVSYWMAKQMQALALQCCDAATAYSIYDKAQVRYFFGRRASEKTRVIPIGIDVSRFRPPNDKLLTRSRLGLPIERTIVLTVRRLVPRMGLNALIKAMAQLKRDFPQAVLYIVGAGPLRAELERLVLQLDMADTVRFAGYVPDTELVEYYQAADLFVLPTEELEGFGIVTLEALASGLPVLGTHKGATPSILRPLSKTLVINESDPASIANGITDWLTNPDRFPGPDECRRYAERHYAWEKVASVYIGHIENLCTYTHRCHPR